MCVQISILPAVGAAAVWVFSLGLVTATPAAADCSTSSGVTLCSQGDVRGSDSGPGPGTTRAGPWYPYPCEYDYYCDDGGVSIILGGGDVDIDRPGGGPNRPSGGGGRGGRR